MTREPKIPMSPEELPQQRIHEVVALPKRPEEFDFKVGYELVPYGELPKNAPIKSTYLCQVEWAWSPAHNRLDAYYLHRGRTHQAARRGRTDPRRHTEYLSKLETCLE